MSDEYAIVDPQTIESEPFTESGLPHQKLSAALGCTDSRVNTCTLEPGHALEYHSHVRQEEVYVLVDGPGHIKVDGEIKEVPEGGVVRVAPETPRKVLNQSDHESSTWVMFGAPPVGTIDDFGEYVVESE